jgi:hypothetical protein
MQRAFQPFCPTAIFRSAAEKESILAGPIFSSKKVASESV